MKLLVQSGLDTKQDICVLGVFEGDSLSSISKTLAKDVALAVKSKRFRPEFGQMYSTKVSGMPYERVIVAGLGKKKEMTLERARRVLGKAVKSTKSMKLSGLTTNLPMVLSGMFDDMLLGRALAEAALLGNYKFTKYFAPKRKEKYKSLTAVSLQWKKSKAGFGKGLKQGKIIADATMLARDLVNEPANVMNSHLMEKMARQVARHPKVKLKVLGKAQLEKLGMHSMLGVNLGSANPPKLIILEYNGGSGKPVAFLGKGITFDSGGYNIKPSGYMEDMKTDMGGSAAVLGTIKAASELGVKKNLIGVMGMCENMVSADAQRPGDIVKAYNGKTIEIGNTDAEGRLVLADALAYTEKKYKPAVMVDLATLTGACVVALGLHTAAVMGRHDDLNEELKEAGLVSGDKVWPLPFFEDYQDAMDGSISDLNNICTKGRRYGAGSITAGVFLSKFVTEKTRWAHLDIAGSAYWDVIEGDYTPKGGTGSGVRVLSYWLLGK